jgi:hypothetical protein
MTTSFRDTGIKLFDRRSAYGGLPIGKPIAYQYDLMYQGDVLLYELANNHSTKYVTTTKTPERVKELVYYSSSPYAQEQEYSDNLEVLDGLTESAAQTTQNALESLEEDDLLIIDRYGDVVQELGAPDAVTFTERLMDKVKETNSLCFLSFRNDEEVSRLEEVVIGQIPGLMTMDYTEVGSQLRQVLRTHRIRGFDTEQKNLSKITSNHEVKIESGQLSENADDSI